MRTIVQRRALGFIGAIALGGALTLGLPAPDAQAWSLEEAAKPYAGTAIRGICDGYAPCLAYIELKKEFEAVTGITVNLEVADLQAIQTQFLTEQVTGSNYFDFVEVISFSSGVFPSQGFVHPLSDFTSNEALRDPAVDVTADLIPDVVNTCCVYEGVQYAVPTKFVMPYMIYRSDLVTDEEKANFQAKYDYDMPLPPTEWQQYYDLSQFYTRKKGETLAGQTLEKDFYGTVIAFKRHLTIIYDYERLLLGMGSAYTNDKGEVQFDQDGIGLKALEFMLSLRPYSIPSYMEATWDEQYAEMCNGNIFIEFSWGDTTPFLEIPADCPASAGKMAYFPNLGSQVSQAEAQGWYIPKSAQNGEAAWLFVQWLQTKDVQVASMKLGGLPTRLDVIRMPEWQAEDWPNRPRDALHIYAIDNKLLYSRPANPAWLAWTDIIMEEFSAAGADAKSAEEAVKSAGERMRAAAEGQ
jgi:multiple sugar transport system substrate-binding protein